MHPRPQGFLHAQRHTHWVWHLVLAAFVLLAQVAAVRHSLQHIKKADPDALHTVCVECLGLHAADQTGPARTPPPLQLARLPEQLSALPTSDGHSPSLTTAYLSRAPPLLSA
jgi:cytochrome c553